MSIVDRFQWWVPNLAWKRVAVCSLIIPVFLLNTPFSTQTAVWLVGAAFPETEGSSEWMGIYAHGEKIGFATSQMTETEDGYSIHERVILKVNLQGTTRKLERLLDLQADHRLSMRSFWIRLISEPVKLEMEGKLKGDLLLVEIRSAERTRIHKISVNEVPWLSQNLRYLLRRESLEIGRKLAVSLFDPLTLTCKPMEILVEGSEFIEFQDKRVLVLRLLYSWNGLRSHAWSTVEGEIIKEEGFGGLSLMREAPEEARKKGWGADKAVDLVRAAAIPVNIPIPSPRELTYLKVRFRNCELKRYATDDQRQKLRGQEVEVMREDLARITPHSLPFSSSPEEGILAATPLIQSDDPQIQRLAEDLVVEEENALENVRRIIRWVHNSLRKVPTVSVPSAVEVLRTRQGDCNEHAVLFAALARAAGIPTKICSGIVYEDQRFCYHAWNEVYVGTWISVDPLLGQVPADVTHVKFAEGDLESQIRLMPLVGILEAEILAYR